MKNLSIRARIIVLVVLAALPTLALTLYSALGERAHAVKVARADVKRLAGLAAQQQEQITEGVRLTLVAISLMPAAVRNDTARCNDYLATLLANSGAVYHSIGIIGVDGRMQCNSKPWPPAATYDDRRYFSIALRTGKFAIGEYQIGRTTGLQAINLSYPMTDGQGKVTGVAFVGLDLHSLNKMAEMVRLPELGVLVVVDHEGTVLSRNPPVVGRVGGKIPYPDVMKVVLAGREGEFDAIGQGNLDRIIAFNTVATNPDGSIPMRVIVSVPKSVILANANRALMRDLSGILGATALLLVGAWYGADLFMLRPIRTLLGVARDVETGNLSARTRLGDGKDELSMLGLAFDRMASALQAHDAELQQALRAVKQQAITDPLTGLHNRRYLLEILARELALAARNDAPLAVMMLDIDRFKEVNDAYGHEAGDRVLREVARAIAAAVRGSDYTCRYGGEEFLIVLPSAPVDGALLRAETIRAAIGNASITCLGDKHVGVTVSIGIAVFPDNGTEVDALLRVADEALYEAKSAGRNRIVFSKAVPGAACGAEKRFQEPFSYNT